jgi:hypothetical protein
LRVKRGARGGKKYRQQWSTKKVADCADKFQFNCLLNKVTFTLGGRGARARFFCVSPQANIFISSLSHDRDDYAGGVLSVVV